MAVALVSARLVPAPLSEREVPLGPEARLRRIVECHHAFLWRSLRRLGVEEAFVDDATQAVLLVVARRLAEIEPRVDASGRRALRAQVSRDVAAGGARRDGRRAGDRGARGAR